MPARMCEVDLDMGSESGSGEGQKPLLHSHRQNLKSRFELLKTLGEGTYGKVKLAREKTTDELVSYSWQMKKNFHVVALSIRLIVLKKIFLMLDITPSSTFRLREANCF